MHQLDELHEGALKFARRQPVDVKELIRPADAVLFNVPRPAAEVCQALRFHQLNIGVRETAVRITKPPVRFAEPAVGFSQRGGTLFDPIIKLGVNATKIILAAPAHRNIRAQRQARHRHAEHEGEKQQEGLVQTDLSERTQLCDGGPDRKNCEQQANGCRVPRPAPQRRQHKRQDREESERARIFRAWQQRTESDQADGHGAAKDDGDVTGFFPVD